MRSVTLDLPDTLDPASTVVLLDIDGTLAPIRPDPVMVEVPEGSLRLIDALKGSYAAVGCVSGRGMPDMERLVPIEGLWFAASHGMHVRSPEGEETIDEIATAARPQLQLAATMAQTVGWRYEDKGTTVTLHFRGSSNPGQTEAQMRSQIVTVLDPRIVEVRGARQALEIRPQGAATKGTAAMHIATTAGAKTVVFVGDDRTDADAFVALADGEWVALRVAVASDEAPPELLELADAILPSQLEVEPFLRQLAERAGVRL